MSATSAAGWAAWAAALALLAAPLAGAPETLNQGPQAAFTFAPSPANRVDPTAFTDASDDPDGAVVAWGWDFGGAGASSAQHPVHTFTALGTYQVTLAVQDDLGAAATVAHAVPVVNLLPAVDFEAAPVHPDVNEVVAFHDRSTDRDGAVVAWAWDFGDGATSSLQHPMHAYIEGGWYPVTLTATDADGGMAARTRLLYVCAPGAEIEPAVVLWAFRVEFDACIHLRPGLLA